MSSCIVILGMHREFNDFLAGLLSASGVPFVAQEERAVNENPARTVAECDPLQRLHNAILDHFGSCFNDLRPLPENWWREPALDGYKRELVSMIEPLRDRVPFFGIQDTLMSRCLPLWLDLFEALKINPHFIIIVSPSIRVKEEGRGEIHVVSSYLWMADMLAAESGSRGFPRVFQAVEDLSSEPLETLRTISEMLHFQLSGDYDAVFPNAKKLSRQFDHLLSSEPMDDCNPTTKMANDLYAVLLNGCHAASLNNDRLSQIDSIGTVFTAMRTDFFASDGLEQRYKKLRNYVQNLEIKHVAIMKKMEEMRACISDLLAERNDLVAQQKKDLQDCTQKMGLQHTMLNTLYQKNSKITETIDRLHGSRSWRITRPLRAITEFFRGY